MSEVYSEMSGTAQIDTALLAIQTAGVKQSIITVATGRQLRTIQITTENMSVLYSLSTVHRDCLPRNSLNYLLIVRSLPTRVLAHEPVA